MKRGIRRKVEALWAQIPDVECKGLCFEGCGPIGMSLAERRIIEDETGMGLLPFPEGNGIIGYCPYLTPEKRCSIYAVRPAVCRGYGAVPEMECGYGCKPGRPFSAAMLDEILRALRALGGAFNVWLGPPQWRDTLARGLWGIQKHELPVWHRIREKVDHNQTLNPEEKALLQRALAQHHQGEEIRKGI